MSAPRPSTCTALRLVGGEPKRCGRPTEAFAGAPRCGRHASEIGRAEELAVLRAIAETRELRGLEPELTIDEDGTVWTWEDDPAELAAALGLAADPGASA